MSRKQPLDFRTEVQRSFEFLVVTYGLSDPDYSEVLLPAVHYQRPDLQIQVALESGDAALLLGSEAEELVRGATEHQVDRAGNPKRRKPGMAAPRLNTDRGRAG